MGPEVPRLKIAAAQVEWEVKGVVAVPAAKAAPVAPGAQAGVGREAPCA